MKLPSTIQTILFDLDNTLIDRDRAMEEAVRHWLKNQGTIDDTSMKTELDCILEKDKSGYTDRDLFCEWLCRKYANATTRASQTTREVLRDLQELTISYLQPDPEILETLHHLKQEYQLVIATNGSQYVQQKKIAQAKLDSLFSPDQVYISEMLGHQKPGFGFYHQILIATRKSPEQCIMVGDNYIHDIEAARQCGLHTCWIDHRRSSEKKSADRTFNHITELRQWLRASI